MSLLSNTLHDAQYEAKRLLRKKWGAELTADALYELHERTFTEWQLFCPPGSHAAHFYSGSHGDPDAIWYLTARETTPENYVNIGDEKGSLGYFVGRVVSCHTVDYPDGQTEHDQYIMLDAWDLHFALTDEQFAYFRDLGFPPSPQAFMDGLIEFAKREVAI